MRIARLLFYGLAVVPAITAHDHHGGESKIPEGKTVSAEPLGTIMWIHIFIQMLAYGVVFPIGMIFGIGKSRWHVPTQILGTALAIASFFLGHAHTDREYTLNNVHASFAWILQILLVAQVVLGLYLKAHWEKGRINGRLRALLRPCHSIIGKLMPILSWTQMVFGGIAALGICQGEYLGQCVAHFIMGSAFIAYGILLTIILLVGQLWIRNSGRSQEFYDSAVIAISGCINTFTEHRWGTAWVRNDWQHTAIGIIWWCAGAVGMWLSWDYYSKKPKPKRNFIPGAVLFVTGWTMSAHPQELMVSAATHAAFGFALMAAGVSRIVEIAFILKDKHSIEEGGRGWSSFQFIPIFCLYAAGFLLMGANAEQMALIDASSIDHVSYILVLLSVACIVFLFANVIIYIYDHLANATEQNDNENSKNNSQGHVEEGEYELHGLISEDNYDDDPDESKPMLNGEEGGSSFEGSRAGRVG
ncbi:hypothetical protein BJX66DRAFT_318413 [Aspergillus keveii]|uniref:Integral membrane protein n=1 Tax=Aspergillus keveii TaxID=714993 RepID=A0ABR4FJT8_9EURO